MCIRDSAQAVLSVTSMAADAIGIGDVVGTLQPGKEADIIVVNGDPTRDVSSLGKVAGVFLGGTWIDRGSNPALTAIRQSKRDS